MIEILILSILTGVIFGYLNRTYDNDLNEIDCLNMRDDIITSRIYHDMFRSYWLHVGGNPFK